MSTPSQQELSHRAYASFRAGELEQAAAQFDELLRCDPGNVVHHYMQGLVHKYRRDWRRSLDHNMRSLALRGAPDQATQWNAAIAATALGDWAQARRQWTDAGISVPEGEGPITSDYGLASVRLNPWGDGETVYARRIDPARARLLNVPMPESGFRFGDVVLHDGAATGWRSVDGTRVPVFNVMQLLERSDFQTFSVFVDCVDPEAVASLLETGQPGIGYIEDWTTSYRIICLRCSYGVPHDHHDGHAEDDGDRAWKAERVLGVAATGRAMVDHALQSWQGPGRVVQAVETNEVPLTDPEDGVVWWRGLDETEDESTEADASK